jgi:uncharacterized protein (UPF0332 family)
MNEATRELIRYRLAEARETLSDAEDLLRKGSVRSAANRTYYAMFYATLAVLATRNLSSSKHTGMIGLLHREFVKPGIFPKELAEALMKRPSCILYSVCCILLLTRMLDLKKQQARAPKKQSPSAKQLLDQKLATTDQQIDQLVYELYGLTEDEIRIVEGR